LFSTLAYRASLTPCSTPYLAAHTEYHSTAERTQRGLRRKRSASIEIALPSVCLCDAFDWALSTVYTTWQAWDLALLWKNSAKISLFVVLLLKVTQDHSNLDRSMCEFLLVFHYRHVSTLYW